MENNIIAIIDDKSTDDTREIIFVPAKFKNVIEQIVGLEVQAVDVVKSTVLSFRRETDVAIEVAEDLVTNLKSHYEEQRKNLRKLYEEEFELSYSLWEELDKKRSETTEKIKEIREETKCIVEEVKELKESINGLNLYGMDKLLEVVRTFANLDDKSKEVLSFIIGQYHREN